MGIRMVIKIETSEHGSKLSKGKQVVAATNKPYFFRDGDCSTCEQENRKHIHIMKKPRWPKKADYIGSIWVKL